LLFTSLLIPEKELPKSVDINCSMLPWRETNNLVILTRSQILLSGIFLDTILNKFLKGISIWIAVDILIGRAGGRNCSMFPNRKLDHQDTMFLSFQN